MGKDIVSSPEMREAPVVLLAPAQLIAMNDYPPLHSPEAFAAYRHKFRSGERVEPVVVVPADIVIAHLKKNAARFGTYAQKLGQFLATHPAAAYFMLGGKHRSAAATMLGVPIPCVVVSGETDVAVVHCMMAEGKLTGVPSVGKDFEETLMELDDHFFERQSFWDMEEKTKAMRDNGDISL
jgi:hypothetical protein